MGDELKTITANDAEFHYREQGSGPPLVLVHGGLDDYRYWLPHLEPFTSRYRVITYSRRYNHPNRNSPMEHSAQRDAEDLAALMNGWGVRAAHVAGASWGGYAALLLAVARPELVRSLVLAEAAVIPWLEEIPGARPLLDELMNDMWRPAGERFRAGQEDAAVRFAIDWFLGKGMVPGVTRFDELPAEMAEYFRCNALEWKVLTTSPAAFSALSREAVARLAIPVLLLSGARSLPLHHAIDAELERLLPQAVRVVLAEASHDIWSVSGAECGQHVSRFLARRD